MSSIQHALLRIRSPRVQITYDVEIGSAVEKKELPFVLGILSDLSGDQELSDLKTRQFIDIDRDNFNLIMESINPKISFMASDVFSDNKNKKFNLEFKSFKDFEPAEIAKQIPNLEKLLNTRSAVKDLMAKLDGNDDFLDEFKNVLENSELKSKCAQKDDAVLDEIIKKGNLQKEGVDYDYLKNIISKTCAYLIDNNVEFSEDQYSLLILCLHLIDQKLSDQLNQILHAPEFQKLEASWRGLHLLVHSSETDSSLKLKVLPISKAELTKDLEKATEFDQSNLFKKVYEQEYGTLGGIPYSCLLADFSFGKSNNDVKLLKMLSTVAAAAHAPLIGATDPNMFDLNNFSEIQNPRDLSKIFESSEFAAYNSFRETTDSRYVTLLLPRVLMRAPYGSKNVPCPDFNFEEEVEGSDTKHFCWGNPVFAMGCKITQAYSEHGWTSAIRGVEGGGKVEELPVYTYKTTSGDLELKCPTEVTITDRREKELSDLGFIALCHAKGTDYAVFFGSQSTQKPKKYNLADATANAAISARLPYLLNASRFAHYIKIMMRDKIGSFMSAGEIQVYLQNWIADYVLLSDDAPQSLKAQYPLREGSINVIDDPENPGAYKAVMLLRPHFQLEELTVSLRLVAKLGGA